MSSILKALKKIEEDSPPPQTHPALPNPIISKQVLYANSKRRRRKLLYLVLVLLVIIVAAGMAFSQRRLIIAKMMSIVSSESPTAGEGADSSRSSIYRAKVSGKSAKPAPKPPTANRLPKTQPKEVVTGSRDKKYQTGTQSSKRRSISSPPPPQTTSGTRKSNTLRNSRIQKPSQTSPSPPGSAPVKRTAAPKDTQPTKSVAGARQPTKTRSRETYDRIPDSKLKLQALAWSDDAVRRMVVINGRIVHEGESVDGYQVVKIRTEDVIVNEGGKSWRLEFGLQQ